MIANKYQEWTLTTAVYPHAGLKDIDELAYLGLGLSGEAGEVANIIKKLLRDPERHDELMTHARHELGDVMWYLCRLAAALGITMDDVMSRNVDMLEGRKMRGRLGGSGDER